MGLLLSGKNPAAYKTAERSTFTATAGQTTFTVPVGYNVGDIDVFLNGLKLVEGDDFFATNGTTVVLASGANAGDSLSVVCYYNFLNSSSYTKAESDNRYVLPNGQTPMTSYLRTPNYGVSSYSDSANVSLEANPGLGTQGTSIKAWGRSVATNGGDIHYVSDTRGAGATHRFYGWNGTSLTNFMNIDSSGRMTRPTQPFSIVRFASNDVGAYNNTINGSVAKPTTIVYNLGSMYNSSTGNFTAPVSGLYEFSFSTNMYNSTAGAWIDVRTHKNGSMYNQHYSDKFSSGWQLWSFCDKVYLNQNEYVSLVMATASGTTGSDLNTYSLLCFRLVS